MKEYINVNDLMLVSKTQYKDMQNKIQQGFEYAQERDNKIEELNYIIDDLNNTIILYESKLADYHKFFELFKKFTQK